MRKIAATALLVAMLSATPAAQGATGEDLEQLCGAPAASLTSTRVVERQGYTVVCRPAPQREGPIDGTVCPVLAVMGGTGGFSYPGIFVIESDGDTWIQGVEVMSCPPYES